MPSATYRMIAQAILERKQVLCMYDGFPRAVCPVMLGHRQGRERALTYQFAGGASKGLPAGGQWKCLDLAKMSDVELRSGAWHDGASHSMPQHCIDEVDLDINPGSPYRPRRPLQGDSPQRKPSAEPAKPRR
jgi:hypothetical protein